MEPLATLPETPPGSLCRTHLDEEPVLPVSRRFGSRNRLAEVRRFRPAPIQRAHTLDAGKFPPPAAAALVRLALGEWSLFSIDELNEALDELYASHYWAARKSDHGPDAPVCIEIRECLYALCDVWARKWFECGEHEFHHKLQVYYRLGGRSRSSARDKMLSQALERLEMARAASVQDANAWA